MRARASGCLLYTNNKNATRQEFMAFARTRHVSELMIPAEIIFMEKLPMLGTGKVDLVNLAKMAKEERAEQAAPSRWCRPEAAPELRIRSRLPNR